MAQPHVTPVPQGPAPGREAMFRRPPEPALSDRALEANAYAISYRLLGDRGAAAAVAGIAAERLRQDQLTDRPDWLCHLALFTLEQTGDPGALRVGADDTDRYASIRAALRRRLARATPRERIAGSLVHLAGYPARFVGELLGCSEAEALEQARILAPPPGVAYRELGDPHLTHADGSPGPGARPARRRRPHWVTVVVIVAVLASVIAATQLTGPRPTLGPPEEGSTAVEQVQLNGGPLTQLTSE